MTTDADVESVTDVLGEPYLAETIPLPPDDEGEVVATLVRRSAGCRSPVLARKHVEPQRACAGE